MTFRSEGAWALDAESDKTSYEMYLEGDNRWDVEEIFMGYIIDVRRTLTNIINRMDSSVTYYYKDHITNNPNMDSGTQINQNGTKLKLPPERDGSPEVLYINL